MMNYAEMIDRAANALIEQGAWSTVKLSETHRICAYRGRNGTACAVGLLIADEEYEKALELSDSSTTPQPCFSHVMQVMGWEDHTTFFTDMQYYLHDKYANFEFSPDLVLEGAKKMKELYCDR